MANAYTDRKLTARYPTDLAAWKALSKHYREFQYLLDVVQKRFRAVLDGEQTEALTARRHEAEALEQEWLAKESNG